jgi:molybdopterin synthase sulfur carrier subunit
VSAEASAEAAPEVVPGVVREAAPAAGRMPFAPVRVVLPGMLRDLADGRAEIEVDSPSASQSVADLLDRAFAAHRVLDGKVRDERGEIRRHVKVFVNGEDATRGQGVDTPVPSGARVHIVNAVSGG